MDSSEYESGGGSFGVNWLAESSGPISSEVFGGETKRGFLIARCSGGASSSLPSLRK